MCTCKSLEIYTECRVVEELAGVRSSEVINGGGENCELCGIFVEVIFLDRAFDNCFATCSITLNWAA